MAPRTRKSTTVVTGGRRVTRQQARLNDTLTPEACPCSPRGSLASGLHSRKNAITFPRAAKRIRGGMVNGKRENVVMISDESDNDSDSDEGSQSPSDFEAGLSRYARRPSNIGSTSRAGITGNTLRGCRAITSNVNGAFRVGNSISMLIDDVRHNLDNPFSALSSDNFNAENVPRNSANIGNRIMPSEEPTNAVERPQESACNVTKTCSFGLTEMISMFDLDSGMDEVQSPAVGTVNGYIVKQEFFSILRRLIEKYGDIAADCTMESLYSRSSSLENLCKIIKILQEKSFNELSLAEITNFLAQVHDLGKIGMKVDWFEKTLQHMEAAKRAIKESSSLKEEKLRNAELVKELQTKLEDHRTQSIILNDMINEEKRKLELFEAKFGELRESEKLTKEHLKKAEDNSRKLNQISSDAVRKVQFFVKHQHVDYLL